MYRVVIAEDEDIIRKGLVYTVPWMELDCVVAAEAQNGIEGIEAIQKHHPDIVLADIDMPILDGLGMIGETFEEYEYAAILLSGYSTFEYAQKAIRYGVLDYLLKPLDIQELKQVVVKAQKHIQVRKAYLEQESAREELKKVNLVGEKMPKTDTVVWNMLEYIKKNYGNKIIMKDVASQFNYSEVYLNKKFKEVMGTTFIEYLNRYRIQQALEMLRDGTVKIRDISWKCGVGEYKYFNIVFKKYIGCTPKEYAELIKKG